MSLPCVYNAARTNPSDQFVLVTQPFIAQMLVDAPLNLTTEPFDKKKINNIVSLMSFARQLHFKFPHAIIVDLHDVLRTKVIRTCLRCLGHSTYYLKKPRDSRKKLLKKRSEKKVPSSLYLPRITNLYEVVMQRAGIKFEYPIGPIIPLQKRFEHITIGFAPHAQYRGKMITRGQSLELINQIRRFIPDSEIVLYGARGREWEENKEIMTLSGKGVRLTDADTLTDEVWEISQLHCMISMDSANQHIAAMVGTPVVSIWGTTHPAAGFMPFGIEEEYCYGIDMACRPCSIYGINKCHRGDWACLEGLDMSIVAQRVAQIVLS